MCTFQDYSTLRIRPHYEQKTWLSNATSFEVSITHCGFSEHESHNSLQKSQISRIFVPHRFPGVFVSQKSGAKAAFFARTFAELGKSVLFQCQKSRKPSLLTRFLVPTRLNTGVLDGENSGTAIIHKSGLKMTERRDYSPHTGRFLSADTFAGLQSDPRTLHKYGYANADPVNNVDPSGRFSIGESATTTKMHGTLAKTAGVNYLRTTFPRIGLILLLAGVLNTSHEHRKLTPAVESDPQTRAELATSRTALKTKVEREVRKHCKDPVKLLYHYTDRAAAQAIYASQAMNISPRKSFGNARATRQETLNGARVGLVGNPGLRGPLRS